MHDVSQTTGADKEGVMKRFRGDMEGLTGAPPHPLASKEYLDCFCYTANLYVREDIIQTVLKVIFIQECSLNDAPPPPPPPRSAKKRTKSAGAKTISSSIVALTENRFRKDLKNTHPKSTLQFSKKV